MLPRRSNIETGLSNSKGAKTRKETHMSTNIAATSSSSRCSLRFVVVAALGVLCAPSSFVTSFVAVAAPKTRPLLSSHSYLSMVDGGSSASFSSSSSSGQQQRRPRVLILGGGFGGINAALTLADLPWPSSASTLRPEIVLVDRSERFVFLPLLYELCVGDASLEEVAPTFRSLLRNAGSDSLTFVRGDVRGIDASRRRAYIDRYSDSDSPSSGPNVNANVDVVEYEYDALILATGMQPAFGDEQHFPVPGANEYALPFSTVDHCYELRKRFEKLDEKLDDATVNAHNKSEGEGPVIHVVVIGGGYSGVELALNAAERLDAGGGSVEVRVTLVHRGGELLENAKDHNRLTGTKRLEDAGVTVLTESSVVEVLPPDDDDGNNIDNNDDNENHRCIVKINRQTSVEENENDNDNSGGTTMLLPADLLLWTAGTTTSGTSVAGIRNSAFSRDASGRVVTDQFLRARTTTTTTATTGGSDDNGSCGPVFAVGDCARVVSSKRNDGANGGPPYPATAQVAMQQATVASWNVFASLVANDDAQNHNNNRGSVKNTKNDNNKLLPFRYADLGEMMTLGRDNASVASGFGEVVKLDGGVASWVRRAVYAARMPTPKQGLKAALDGTARRLVRSKATGSTRSKKTATKTKR